MTLSSLYQRASREGMEMLGCDHAMLLLLDQEKRELWTGVQEEENVIGVPLVLSGVRNFM